MTTTRETLKTYFSKGAIPKATEFAELIDQVLIQNDDKLFQTADGPLGIKATAEGTLLNFYDKDNQLTWQLKQQEDKAAGLSLRSGEQSRLFIDSATGNIGIGTTETDKAKLTVAGDTTLNGKLTVTGNVGIGTTEAGDTKLTVAGDTTLNGRVDVCNTLTVKGATTTTKLEGLLTIDGALAANNGASITVQSPGTGTIASNKTTVTGSGTAFGTQLRVGDQIIVAPRTSRSTQTRVITAITNDTTLTISAPFYPDLPVTTSFRFLGPGLLVQKGKVGIGTANPQSSLQIVGPPEFDSSTILHITNGATKYGRTNLVLTGRFESGNDSWSFGTQSRNSIVFAMNTGDSKNVGALGTEQFSIQLEGNSKSLGFMTATLDKPALVIQQNGNVGIGTTEPGAYKLNVAGDTNVAGNLNVTGTITQTRWTEVTSEFSKGWNNYGGEYNHASYFKDSLGFVHLKGLVKGGTFDWDGSRWQNSTAIFTLPLGYRPAGRELHIVGTYSGADTTIAIGRVDILTDGAVRPMFGRNEWLSLDGITFRAG